MSTSGSVVRWHSPQVAPRRKKFTHAWSCLDSFLCQTVLADGLLLPNRLDLSLWCYNFSGARVSHIFLFFLSYYHLLDSVIIYILLYDVISFLRIGTGIF